MEQPKPTNQPRGDAHALTQADDASLARMRALLDRPLPAEDIAANTVLVASKGDVKLGRTRSVLVFVVGDERLALDAEATHRVVPVTAIRRVPHRTNRVFAGIANSAGELTLVANIGAAIGIEQGAQQTHFIVIGDAGARWAFGADRVEGVRRVDESTVLPAPTTVRHAADGCTKSLVPLIDGDSDALIPVFDAKKLTQLVARSFA